MTEVPTSVVVTVRYFAAASAAAEREAEDLPLPDGTTIADLVDALGTRHSALGPVLERCSYLLDGVAVRDPATVLQAGHTVDVLPPFAGG